MRPVLLHDKYKMNMRSIKNRLLLKGRKNKKTIITILLALVAMTGLAQKHLPAFQYSKEPAVLSGQIIGNNQQITESATTFTKTLNLGKDFLGLAMNAFVGNLVTLQPNNH